MSDKEVYICFGRWATLKSWLIRWVTRSEWSHVWIEYSSDRWQSRMVVHSDLKGVIVEPVSNFYERRSRPSASAIYKVSKGRTDLGFLESKRYLGKDYGYIAVIINIFLLLLWRAGFKGLEGVRDVGRYICSEFCTLFIKHCQIPCDLDPEHTWPGKLNDWITSHPNYFRKVL